VTKVTIFLHYEEEWQRRTVKSSIILSGSLHFLSFQNIWSTSGVTANFSSLRNYIVKIPHISTDLKMQVLTNFWVEKRMYGHHELF
jgi:hypothetical protein